MKLIQCILRKEKLNYVVESLMTMKSRLIVYAARGHGGQRGRAPAYRGVEYQIELLPKVMLEIATDDHNVDDLASILSETARTGEVGDGQIFVVPIDEAYHVRTGFMD